MDFTSEGLFLAAFLLLPGFVYYFVSRNTKTTYREPPGDARVVLDSFAVTLVLVAAEATLLALLTLFIDSVNRDVKSILKDGLGDYIDDKPLTSFYIIVAIGVTNVIAMAVLGWFDWIESLIVWTLRHREQAPWSVWYQIIHEGPDPRSKPGEPLGVRVRLKDGSLYGGSLAGYPMNRSESRDIALWQISFSESGDPEELRPVSTTNMTALIVPIEQVKGVEFIYHSA